MLYTKGVQEVSSAPSLPGIGLRSGCVVVHWGNAALTRVCLESLLRDPDISPRDISLVENGMESALNISGVQRIVLEHNVGYGAAVNIGCRSLFNRGYTAALVLNNDVLYVTGALRNMEDAVHAPRVGCVGAIVAEGDAAPVYGGGRVDWLRGRAHLFHERHPSPDYISGACMLITHACFDDVGGMPERYFLYWEDVAFGFHCRRRGWRMRIAETPALQHARSPGTRGSLLKTYYLVRNGALFVREYAPMPARRWLLALESLRRTLARRRKRWAVLRGLLDAERGVTGPISSTIDLSCPPQ